MRGRTKNKIVSSICAVGLGLGYLMPAAAAFLELPEVKEAQEFHPKTLLRDMDIPPVKERSPDPTAGPRIAVSEFRIQGLVEYPELGITREALATLVEKIRFDLMAEGKQLESGYTIDELGQISDLLVDIEQETLERHVTPLDVQKLVFLVRDQQAKRGITLGQIESVANKITTFYRERGFILAKAYIPKQQVRDGIVNMTLLLGMLGDVNVTNNKLYSNKKIKAAFNDLMTKPVTNAAVEERLYLINDLPGLSVDGYFEPGYQVGDTRLNINVKDERNYNANVRLDNHGSASTGRNRLYADAQLNNGLGMADSLSVAGLLASSPSNTTYYRFKYSLLPFSPRLGFDLEASKNQYTLKQQTAALDLDIAGDVNVLSFATSYTFKRSRTVNRNLELKYESIESKVDIGAISGASSGLNDKVHNITATYNFDSLEETSSKLHQGFVKLTSGAYDYGEDIGQDKSYKFISGGYTSLGFWKLPLVDANTRVVVRTAAQYAGKNISQLLRFSLAGPTRARAYDPSLFTTDDGLYLGVDWYFNSPGWFDFNITDSVNFKNITKPFVFADFAYGKQHALLSTDQDATGQLFDAGIGLQFSQTTKFQGNLQLAFPIKEKFTHSGTTVTDKAGRIVFDMQYSF